MPKPMLFHAAALLCKGGGVHGRQGHAECWLLGGGAGETKRLKDESVYREYVTPLGQSSSKNRVGLMRDCYELSAAIFVTDRNQMYL